MLFSTLVGYALLVRNLVDTRCALILFSLVNVAISLRQLVFKSIPRFALVHLLFQVTRMLVASLSLLALSCEHLSLLLLLAHVFEFIFVVMFTVLVLEQLGTCSGL